MAYQIAITGIGGYVGSAVAYELIANGHHIIGYGYDENFPILQKQFGNNITLIAGDITDEKKLTDAFHDADVVIHTASPTTEKFCIEKPWHAYKSVIYGTRNVAYMVRELKIPLLIHFSTQAVYMNFKPRELPLREDMDPQPDTIYGVLKLAAERELAEMPAVIVRPANIYGKNSLGIQRENVISHFVDAAKKGFPLTIKGDGHQRADYVHLNDVVSVIKKLITHVPSESVPMVYNVGSSIARSITEIAQCVAHAAEQHGFQKPLIQYERKTGGMVAADRVLSAERVQVLFPNFPTISFEERMRELFSL